jgi:hypothetical protein
VDRMAAEAPSWAVEAAVGRTVVEAATARDPAPTGSMAVGTSIDMTIGGRIGTAITSTHIGTAIISPILHTEALAGGGLQTADACGCAATDARPMDIGTAIGRTIGTAIIARTADIRTAIMARPTDAVRPMDTDAGNVVTERDKCGPPKQLSGTPCRGAFLPEAASDRRSR